MDDSRAEREPIVSEGRYAIVDADEGEAATYWLVAEDHAHGIPLEDDALDDAETVLSRFRRSRDDPEGTGTGTETPDSVELTCHECGKTWTYTGDDEHAACPNCETEVPVEGIGP